jgi:hypothetical protein
MSEPSTDGMPPAPTEIAPAAAASPPRRSRAGVIVAVAVLIVAGLGGAALYWEPALTTLISSTPRGAGSAPGSRREEIDQKFAALTRQQEALQQQLARLEGEMKTLGARPGQEPQQAATVTALEQRLGEFAVHEAEFEQRVDRYQNQASASFGALRDEVDKLAALQDELGRLAATQKEITARLAKAEARETAAPGERIDQALLLALAPLRAQLQTARPFAAELAALETLARTRPEVQAALQPLDDAAAKGIPDTLTLSRRFQQEVAPAMLRVAASPPAEDWSDRFWARLRSLVVIRRVGADGMSSGDPIEAAVAHAEAALAGNDLAGAVAALAGVPERVMAPAQAWLADARQRLAAERAVAALAEQLTARLAASAEPAAR